MENKTFYVGSKTSHVVMKHTCFDDEIPAILKKGLACNTKKLVRFLFKKLDRYSYCSKLQNITLVLAHF